MRRRSPRDDGQAFPIYITVVGGLLFLAFAYFAVGQAAVNRNGAQTAADAAALAAAQEARDQLAGQPGGRVAVAGEEVAVRGHVAAAHARDQLGVAQLPAGGHLVDNGHLSR